MIVCCFHTGGPYAVEADRLRASLDRLGLLYRIDEVPCRGSWDRNILITPEYIRDVMQATAGPVLYVDADAEFHSVPEFHDGFDIAVHYLKGRELLDGTMWLANNSRSRHLVDQWCSEVREGEWEQKTLERILRRRPDVRVNRLGPEMCYIFDTSKRLHPDVVPVIEHHQASRRLKDEVQSQVGNNR